MASPLDSNPQVHRWSKAIVSSKAAAEGAERIESPG